MKKSLICTGICVAIVTACGVLEKDPQDRDKSFGYTANQLINDFESSSLMINGQIDEVISSISQSSGAEQGTSALMLSQDTSTPIENSNKIEITRNCTVSDKKATVEIERNIVKSLEKNKRKVKINKSANIARVWSLEGGGSVECTASGKYAKISELKKSGNLILNADFVRTKTRKVEGPLRSFEVKHQKEGKRSLKFNSSAFDAESNIETNSVTVNHDISKTSEIKRKSDSFTNESSSATKDLSVVIERDKLTKTWIRKTIESGSVVTTLDNGLVITTNFTNLKFENNGDKCVPVSGALSGSMSITAPDQDSEENSGPDSSEPVSIEFSADFDSGSTNVSIDGAEEPLVFDGCELVSLK